MVDILFKLALKAGANTIRQGVRNAVNQGTLGFTEETRMYEWTTAGDGRVCVLCAKMGGNRYSELDIVGGKVKIPAHPRCRCKLVRL